MYEGVDLVLEFSGKNFRLYALELASFLFTDDEIRTNVLVKSAKTERGTLDQEKVMLIKKTVIAKYGLQGEKLDKAWSSIRYSINQKGRNLKIKWTLKSLFSRSNPNGDGGEI